MKNHKYSRLQINYRFASLVILFLAILGSPYSFCKEKNDSTKQESTEYHRDKFSVNLGGFLAGLSSDLQLGSEQLGLGIFINLEDALGLETSTTVFRGDMEYNFGKRSKSNFRFGYFGFFRNSHKILENEIEIGGITFPIGDEVTSTFNFQIYKLNYDYAFYLDERVKLTASVGLYVMPIKFTASSGNTSGVITNFTAPLPLLGLGVNFAITSKIALKQSIEFLYFDLQGAKGKITDLKVNLEYNPWKHIGFGFGYNGFSMDLSVEAETNTSLDFVGSIKTGYSGLLLYGRYFF